MNNKLKQKI